MNDVLAGIMENDFHNYNPHVVDNLGTGMLKKAVPYLDRLIRENMKTATPKLNYHGIRVLKPIEAYKTLLGNNTGKKIYDTSRSDLYTVELLFTYNGEKIRDRYLLLPYASEGGFIHFSNTMYHLVPVLSDTVITPEEDSLFVRLLKNKLRFERLDRNIIVNGEKFSGNVIYSNINFKTTTTSNNKKPTIVPPAGLYIVCEMGVKDTFKKYAGLDVIVTTDDIDRNKYKDYDIYESTKLKPLKLNNRPGQYYKGHDLKILVPKTKDEYPFVRELVASLIYSFDIYPDTAVEIAKVINSGEKDKELRYFKILLGKLVFGDGITVDRLYNDIDDRMVLIRSYVDRIIQAKLSEINVHVDNFFDLLAYIMSTYSNWLLNSKTYNTNVLNRYVDVLYYILYPIIIGINKTIFDITKRSSRKDMAMNEITQLFNKSLSVRRIFKVVNSSSMNLSLMLVDYSGDNKLAKTSAITALQEQAIKGVDKGKKTVFPPSARTISGPDLFMGSILNLPKKSPTPKVRFNPSARINPDTGRFEPTEHDLCVIDAIDNMLKGVDMKNMRLSSELEETLFNMEEMDSDIE